MKKYLKIGLFSLGIFALFTSCINTLDTHPTAIFDEETVWGSKATAEAFINATYNAVVSSFIHCVVWESRTPNSVQCDLGNYGTDAFVSESFGPGTNFGFDRSGILRRCNLILEKVAASENLSQEDKVELLAHGHFLRGLVFFDQARFFGRFIPICQVFTEADTLTCKIPMTKDLAESYKYVMEDLEIAANDLPSKNPPGLPTKWAAGVILSRAALQAYAYTNDLSYLDKAISAAKKVINESGKSLTTSQGMFNEFDDKNPEILWAYYRLKDNTSLVNYAELINTYPMVRPEAVITSKCPIPLKNANGETFEGWGIYWPTQDLVDNFLVTDDKTGEALPWYETSQYRENIEEIDPNSITEAGQIDQYERTDGSLRRIPTPQDFKQVNEKFPHFSRYGKLKEGATKDVSDIMYEKRDNRFATTVVYDKCKWLDETIETNLGGNLSAGVEGSEDGATATTVTGYYWRKNTLEKPEPRATAYIKVSMHFNLVRLGEAYMNLAEAQLLKGAIGPAVEALNATRTIHGGLAPSKASTEEDAWRDYIRERNCELTNEGGDLYLSYLRWGKYGGFSNEGETRGGIIKALNRPVYKVEINRDRTQFLISQVTFLNCTDRIFTQKRYLLPIHQGFLNTREAYGLDHDQNPGW